MDLVSRESVNELLHRQREMQSYVNQLPTFDCVVWHTYPKEKPTKKSNYLVTFFYCGLRKVFESRWIDDTYRFGYFDKCVIAWAELPSPYQEGAEK